MESNGKLIKPFGKILKRILLLSCKTKVKHYLSLSSLVLLCRMILFLQNELDSLVFIYGSFIFVMQTMLVFNKKLKRILNTKYILNIVISFSLSSHILIYVKEKTIILEHTIMNSMEIAILLVCASKIIKPRFLYIVLTILTYLAILLKCEFKSFSNENNANNIIMIALFFTENLMLEHPLSKKKSNRNNIQNKNTTEAGNTTKRKVSFSAPNYTESENFQDKLSRGMSLETSLLNNLRDGLIVIDSSFKIKHCNNVIASFFKTDSLEELKNAVLNLVEDEKYLKFSRFPFFPTENFEIIIDDFSKRMKELSGQKVKLDKTNSQNFENPSSIPLIKRFVSLKSMNQSFKTRTFLTPSVKSKRGSYFSTLAVFDTGITFKIMDYSLNNNMGELLKLGQFIRVRKARNYLKNLFLRKGMTNTSRKKSTDAKEKNINGPLNFKMIARSSKSNESNLLFMLEFELRNDNSDEVVITVRDLRSDIFLMRMIEYEVLERKFISTLCHELKTPLNSITNMLIMMEETKVFDTDQSVNEYINSALVNSKFLISSIDDFLDYFDLKSKGLELNYQKFNLKALLEETYKTFQSLTKKKGVELLWDYDDAVPDEIINDEKRIRQILFNLLNNAVRHTNMKGVIVLHVKHHCFNHVKLLIQDSGVGMSEEDIKSLGNLESRLHDTHTQTAGFGLCISNYLANQLGKSRELPYGLNVSSECGKGTRFWFLIENIDESSILDSEGNYHESNKVNDKRTKLRTFHQNHTMDPKFILDETLEFEMESGSGSGSGTDFKLDSVSVSFCDCPLVLIVDDGPFNITTCQSILKKLRINSDKVNNGLEAVLRVKSILDNINNSTFCKQCKFYKLIFMDIDMPIMDGLEATVEILRLLQEYHPDKHIMTTILGISAFPKSDMKEKALQAGMVEYIEKPFSANKIKEILNKYCPNLGF